MRLQTRILIPIWLGATISFNVFSNTIQVSAECSIVDAVQAANTDSSVGACPAGSGSDTIILETDKEYRLTTVMVNLAQNTNTNNSVGGPFYLSVNSSLNILGNGATLIGDFQQQSNSTNVDPNDIAVFLIDAQASVELTDLTIKGGISSVRNQPQGSTRSGLVKGIAITNFGQLTLRNTMLTGHKTHLGFIPTESIAEPAVLANYDHLTIQDSQISQNEASGIYTNEGASTTLLRSQISSNRFFAGVINRGQTDIGNSVIAANLGSQIHLENGAMVLHNDTIIGVTTIENGTHLTLANTVMANNGNNVCHFVSNNNTGLIDIGHNWFQDDTCNGIAQGDPQLNVFVTNEHSINVSLLPDSPLVNAGNASICNNYLTSGVDLRLTTRPQGIACDIGAIELETNSTGIVFLQSNTINSQTQSVYDLGGINVSELLFGVSPPTYNGVQPGVVRLSKRLGGLTGFNFLELFARFHEFTYLDQFHINEQISIMGFYPGVSVQPDGTVIASGQFSLSGNRNWQTVNFSNTFPATPSLFLFAQTSNGGQPPVLRARNVSNIGFEATLDEEEALFRSGHIPENIAYFAIYNPIQQGIISINGQPLEYSLAKVLVNHNWTTIFGKQIRLQEELSFDPESSHVNEMVDVMWFDEHIFAQSVTNNGADPFTVRLRQ